MSLDRLVTRVSEDRRQAIARALLATRDDGVMLYVDTQGDDDTWALACAEVALNALLERGDFGGTGPFPWEDSGDQETS